MENKPIIRYYKGIIKLERLTNASPMKTCAYKVLSKNYCFIGFPKDSIHIIPFRLCHKNKTEEKENGN